MKNTTLKLCVTTLLALTISLKIGQTACYAEEQTTEAVKESIDTNTVVSNEGYIDMWSIPVEERSDANFGPGFVNGVPKPETVEVITTVEATPEPVAGPIAEPVIGPGALSKEQPAIVEPVLTPVVTTPATTEVKEETSQEISANQRSIKSNRWGISLTQNEKDVLAQIVYLEAGNQSDIGQQAVVEVVFNRMVKGGWGEGCIGVLSKRRQFSTWPIRHKAKVSAREYRNIDAVLNGETNILPFKTVYFSRGKQNNRVQTRIEDHVFCNE